MAGFEKHEAELDAVSAKVFAANVDPADKAGEVAAEVSFPVGYGVTREIANKLIVNRPLRCRHFRGSHAAEAIVPD